MKALKGVVVVVMMIALLLGVAYGVAVSSMTLGQPRRFNFGSSAVVVTLLPSNLAAFKSGDIYSNPPVQGKNSSARVFIAHYVRFGRLNFVKR